MKRLLGRLAIAAALSFGVYQVTIAQELSQREVEIVTSEAMAGDAEAQNNLGRMYVTGRGVRQDYAQAVAWYEKAAAQGHADAQAYLGVIYGDGKGVRQDYAQAREWFEKAAAQEQAGAQASLGLMYDTGRGVDQDYAKAREWYEKAAEQGNEIALDRLKDGVFLALSDGAIEVKASQLYKDFSENEVRAVQKYKGNSIVLEGKIKEIGFSAINNKPRLIFSVPNNRMNTVDAFFNEDSIDKLVDLNKGEIIKSICRGNIVYTGFSVFVSDCSLN